MTVELHSTRGICWGFQGKNLKVQMCFLKNDCPVFFPGKETAQHISLLAHWCWELSHQTSMLADLSVPLFWSQYDCLIMGNSNGLEFIDTLYICLFTVHSLVNCYGNLQPYLKWVVTVEITSCYVWVQRLCECTLSQSLTRNGWQNGALVNVP